MYRKVKKQEAELFFPLLFLYSILKEVISSPARTLSAKASAAAAADVGSARCEDGIPPVRSVECHHAIAAAGSQGRLLLSAAPRQGGAQEGR